MGYLRQRLQVMSKAVYVFYVTNRDHNSVVIHCPLDVLNCNSSVNILNITHIHSKLLLKPRIHYRGIFQICRDNVRTLWIVKHVRNNVQPCGSVLNQRYFIFFRTN